LTRRGAKPCGLGARDTLRLEAAMPLYGHELTEEIDPFQAGLDWAVKLDKGDFRGREALLRRQKDTSRRQRVGLELSGKRIAREGAVVKVDGRDVGHVTSGTFSPTLSKSIAMAYIEPGLTSPGTNLMVDIRKAGTEEPARGKTSKEEPARVVPLPFYKRGK
jgi:aminomethyltransferase